MAQINVELLSINPEEDPLQFQVEVVDEDGSKKTFNVSTTKQLHLKLTGGLQSPEELVRFSFEFLLEREPKEAILPSFSIDEIPKYFPEYETVVSSRFFK